MREKRHGPHLVSVVNSRAGLVELTSEYACRHPLYKALMALLLALTSCSASTIL